MLVIGMQPGAQILELEQHQDYMGQFSVSPPDFLIQQVKGDLHF